MRLLDEVKQKRDYAQSRKDAGESGYDPAIDFYNRIIAEIESLAVNLQKALTHLKRYDPHQCSPYGEICEFANRYTKWLENEQRFETNEELSERIAGVHKSHLSFDASAR